MAEVVCIACSRPIKSNQANTDCGEDQFHTRCFRCVECFVKPDTSTYTRVGTSVYCEKCKPENYNLSGDDEEEDEEEEFTCTSCRRQVFASEVISAKGGHYHRRCFRCVACFGRLNVDDFYKEGKSLYCPKCKPKPQAAEAARDTTKIATSGLASISVPTSKQVSPVVSPARRSPAQAYATCTICDSTIRPTLLVETDGKKFHRGCFRCQNCRVALVAGKYVEAFGEYYCYEHDPSGASKKKAAAQKREEEVEEKRKAAAEAVSNGASNDEAKDSLPPMKSLASPRKERKTRQLSVLHRVASLKTEPLLEGGSDSAGPEGYSTSDESDDSDKKDEDANGLPEVSYEQRIGKIREEERRKAKARIAAETREKLGSEGMLALEQEITRVEEEEQKKIREGKKKRQQWMELSEADKHKEIQKQLGEAEKQYYDNMIGDLIKMKQSRIEEIERTQAEKRIRKRVRKLRKRLVEVSEREERRRNRHHRGRRKRPANPGERALSVDRLESKRRAFEMLGMSDSEDDSSEEEDSPSDSGDDSGASDASMSMSRRSMSTMSKTGKSKRKHRRSRSYEEPSINILEGEELSVKLALKIKGAKIIPEHAEGAPDVINPFCTITAKDIDGVLLDENKTSVVKETNKPLWKTRFRWSHMHQIHKVEFAFFHSGKLHDADIELDDEGQVVKEKKKKKKSKKKQKEERDIQVGQCTLNIRRRGTGTHKMRVKLKHLKQNAGYLSVSWKYTETVIRAGAKAVDFDSQYPEDNDVHSIPNFLKQTRDLLEAGDPVRGHMPRSLSSADRKGIKKSPRSNSRGTTPKRSGRLNIPGSPRSMSASMSGSYETSRTRSGSHKAVRSRAKSGRTRTLSKNT